MNKGLGSCLGILAIYLGGWCAGPSTGREASQAATSVDRQPYSPVAPANAMLAGVRSNLKVVQEWLGDRDLDSAAEAAEGVRILAVLCAYQSAAEPWQSRAGELARQAESMLAAANKKDESATSAALENCKKALASLEAIVPSGESTTSVVPSRGGRPAVATKGMMKLMDGTYLDAKGAKTVRDLKLFAFALAEEAHATAYLRNDADWPTHAEQLRDAALKVARVDPEGDLQVTRGQLKNVYEHCQACHRAYKR